jgi:glucokinase
MSGDVLAVDIGGTKFAAGLVDAAGRLRGVDRTPTRPGGNAEELWSDLTALLDRVLAAGGNPDIIGVGVGSGGPMRWPSGEVSPLNIAGWRDFPLRERLAERHPDLPVRVHNDAVAVAIAEHWLGAGRGVSHMLGMVVSTGVGGGLVLGGRLLDGATGNAGHIGHLVVDPCGPPCVCGGLGCLEAVARGPALARWAHERGWRADGAATGRDLTDDARAGHPVARAALARGGEAVGVAIASVMALCDLELVVIGGGISQAGDLLFGPLRAALDRHTGLEFTEAVRVVPAGLGQESGLVGAAALLHQGARYWSAG